MPVSSNGERVRTLGWRTDLAIESDRAAVEEHDGFVAVRTPQNPGYHFGNFLLFDQPPQAGDDVRWPQMFEEVFAADTRVRHAAFGWSIEDDPGRIAPFVARGYAVQERIVLTTSVPREFAAPPGLHIRPFRCENDWDKQLALGFATREACYERESYERFKTAQVAYHRTIARRFGAWLGAFEGDRLAGSCGIFSIGDGIARYQDVGVCPGYRNRGVARALISAAGRFARERFAAAQLVIVADAENYARRLYERCGFTQMQREGALWIAHR